MVLPRMGPFRMCLWKRVLTREFSFLDQRNEKIQKNRPFRDFIGMQILAASLSKDRWVERCSELIFLSSVIGKAVDAGLEPAITGSHFLGFRWTKTCRPAAEMAGKYAPSHEAPPLPGEPRPVRHALTRCAKPPPHAVLVGSLNCTFSERRF